jgi:hypothetical protein
LVLLMDRRAALRFERIAGKGNESQKENRSGDMAASVSDFWMTGQAAAHR